MATTPPPQPPADLEQMARAKFDPLSEAEVRLLQAAARGEIAYCGPTQRIDDPDNDPANAANWGADRAIRAELLRWLCTDSDAKSRVDARGVWAHAAAITGKFELPFAVVPFPLGVTRCSVWEDVDLHFIDIASLDLSGTWLYSLNLDHATVKGNVTLQGLRSTGLVQLCGAHVGGNLECDGGRFQNAAKADALWSGVCIDATNARVDGAVLLRDGFAAEGAVRLYGASIGESLDCASGTFMNAAQKDVTSSGVALDATNANVTGAALLRTGFAAEGVVRFYSAQVGGNLECEAGSFKNPAQKDVAGSGTAIEATNLKVSGTVSLRKGFAAEGQVWMYGAQIGGNLDCEGGLLNNPAQADVAESGIALNVEGAKISGAVHLRYEFAAQGVVWMFGAQVGGTLDCSRGKFANPAVQKDLAGNGTAIEGTNLNVTGGALLADGFSADGEVRLFSAQIGGVLSCDAGVFHNPPSAKEGGSGIALNLEGAKVGEAVYLRKSAAEGTVRMFAATVGGNLECDGGKLHNPAKADEAASGTALDVEGAKIGGAVYLRDKFAAEGNVRLYGTQIGGDLECEGAKFESLDLRNAAARSILDDKESWPAQGKLALDGFTYGRIAFGPDSAKDRLAWLGLQETFTRHPYRQLGGVLKQAGDDHGWRLVCQEMERRTWAAKPHPWIARPTSWLLRGTIGYGYFSIRALWWLLALVLVGSAVFKLGYEAGSMVPTDKDAYDSFSAHRDVPAYYEGFHALPYSLENTFPVVKLGVQDKWTPTSDEQAPASDSAGAAASVLRVVSSGAVLVRFQWLQICLGWILGTLFVGGVTGLVRND